MAIFIFIFVHILMLGGIFCCYMLYRNNLVFKIRMRLLDEISILAKQDIEAGRQWYWRYRTFEKYPYIKMVWQLWKFKWELYEILS